MYECTQSRDVNKNILNYLPAVSMMFLPVNGTQYLQFALALVLTVPACGVHVAGVTIIVFNEMYL